MTHSEYSAESRWLKEDRILHTLISFRGTSVSRAEFVRLLQTESTFRLFLSQQLSDTPMPAFCFETPPFSPETLDRPFEFVAVLSPALLSSSADWRAFSQPFAQAPPGALATTFDSLGRDAKLIAPLSPNGTPPYGHLAEFLRNAPDAAKDELWRQVGDALGAVSQSRVTWLSTAGLGVSWLHVRLDSRPKYFRWAPWREVV